MEISEDYATIYALTKLECSVSGILSRARLDDLIEALDMNRRSLYHPREWLRTLGIKHSGKSVGNHKMGIREFSDLVEYELNLSEDDWKPHSHSTTPIIHIHEAKEFEFKVMSWDFFNFFYLIIQLREEKYFY
jgi:hypothetical protein